jgi:heptosyltransferase-2
MRKRRVAEVRQLVQNASLQPAPGLTGGAVPSAAHQMHEYLHLATTLGALGTPLAPALAVDATEVRSALSKFAIAPDRRWLGLNAGAEYGPAKRWPKDRFVSVAQAVQQRTGCGVLIFGGPGDAEVAADIAARVRNPNSHVHNVAGRTSLRELMALLTRCRVLLTNDTGPMHVAAALGVPVVVPFGSTSPELTGPGLPGDPQHRLIKSNAPCAPCFLRVCPIDFRCLNGIAVDQVVNAVLEIWSGPN